MSYSLTKVGRMIVARWEEMRETDIAMVRREIEGFHRDRNEPVVYVSVTAQGSKPPEDEARVAMVRAAEQLMPSLSYMFVVIETGGFMGSVHRSALAGMLLMSKLRKKVKVVSSIEEVLSLGKPVIGVDPSVARARLASEGILEAG